MRRAEMEVLAWLLWFSSLLACIHSEDVLFGIVGETFTFPVEITQRREEINWKKNKDKVAEWDRQNTVTYFNALHNRSLLKDNGCLTIFNLEKNDTGTYELHYWDSVKDHYLNFVLVVLDPPSKPKISWIIEGDNLVLTCISDFQRPLNYTWTLTDDGDIHHGQKFSIPIESVDATKKAACFITFSQTEKTSEISLIECISDGKGYISHKRHRHILTVTSVLFSVVFLLILGFFLFRWIRGRPKHEGGGCSQGNSPVLFVSGEREQLFSVESQEQHNRVLGVKTRDGDGPGKDATDRELNKENGALKDDQRVNDDVNQEEAKGQDGGNGEPLNNLPSCSKEDLKSV